LDKQSAAMKDAMRVARMVEHLGEMMGLSMVQRMVV